MSNIHKWILSKTSPKTRLMEAFSIVLVLQASPWQAHTSCRPPKPER